MGESQVEESTSYGSRIDEAKGLIKQLEAYKTAVPKEASENDDTVLIEKNEKGDVSSKEAKKAYITDVCYIRSLHTSSTIPLRQQRCIRKAKCPTLMKGWPNWSRWSVPAQVMVLGM